MKTEDSGDEWWWWAASSSQTAAGILFYRRGCGRSGAAMPFKAFAIASLFVSAGAAGSVGALHAAGIHTVDDMKEVGKGIRRWIKTQPKETK
ncbi:hypothetical protein HPP92_014063 [Vanilla planifolia]|uniref:Uncharacterized protein n=1 Tax=Vanilla planifolia TaxID=51239 RepID=A0A835QT47_VANPL|nr:hypothetical protein HPP92_014505 [Vanilla planifolia]KAG0474377.1 hypothetical protein HPP92_014063 [Vanilla planifolia]